MTIREIPEFSVIMNASYFKDLKTMHEITDRYTAQCSRPTPELFFWIQLLLLKSSDIVLKSYLEVEIFVFFTLNIVY